MFDQDVLDKGSPVAGVDQLRPVGDPLFGVEGGNMLNLLQQAIAIGCPVGIFLDQKLRTNDCWDFNMDAC